MNIISLESLRYNVYTKKFNLYYPVLAYFRSNDFNTYVVQKGEQMRLDLVMMSIYNNPTVLKEMDVLLFLNNIDNPLNINIDDVIYYPPMEALSSYRYSLEDSETSGGNIRRALATPNKTTKKDSNRKKFIDSGFSLPPVVLDESKQPVRLENGNIVIGGLN